MGSDAIQQDGWRPSLQSELGQVMDTSLGHLQVPRLSSDFVWNGQALFAAEPSAAIFIFLLFSGIFLPPPSSLPHSWWSQPSSNEGELRRRPPQQGRPWEAASHAAWADPASAPSLSGTTVRCYETVKKPLCLIMLRWWIAFLKYVTWNLFVFLFSQHWETCIPW